MPIPRFRVRTLMIAVAVIAVGLPLVRVWVRWNSGPVSSRTLRSLRPGMTKEQVGGIVGAPTFVGPTGNWVILGHGAWWLVIDFDSNARLVGYKEECF